MSPMPIEEKTQELRRLYGHMRHPMLLGPALVLLGTPLMTAGRLLLAVSLLCYTLAFHALDAADRDYVRASVQSRYRSTMRSLARL